MTTRQTFEHTLIWHCPQCGRTERSIIMSKSREVEVDQKVCAGALVSHTAKEMYWTDHSVQEIVTRPGMVSIGQYRTPPSGASPSNHASGTVLDPIPGRLNMSYPQYQFGDLGAYFRSSPGILTDIARLHTPSPDSPAGKAAAARKEKAETLAKLQEGDIVQLVSKAGAVLQGEILALRRGNTSARIKGFDHVGGEAGGHHVYWPLGEFDVEILVESYRLTDEDRAIAVIAGYKEDAFKTMSEARRTDLRHRYATRLARTKEILKGEGG